jgi:hypothetical protein
MRDHEPADRTRIEPAADRRFRHAAAASAPMKGTATSSHENRRP